MSRKTDLVDYIHPEDLVTAIQSSIHRAQESQDWAAISVLAGAMVDYQAKGVATKAPSPTVPATASPSKIRALCLGHFSDGVSADSVVSTRELSEVVRGSFPDTETKEIRTVLESLEKDGLIASVGRGIWKLLKLMSQSAIEEDASESVQNGAAPVLS